MEGWILVLGDGDLSYSAALCTSGSVAAARIVATTLESREDVLCRYALAAEHIAVLEEAGALPLHGIDATRLGETLPSDLASQSFARVIFNFPYQPTGGIKGLRKLLGTFLAESVTLLEPCGVIEVALLAGQGGSPADGARHRGWAGSWRAPLLGTRCGLVLSSVSPWRPPEGGSCLYAPKREPGNKDTVGGKSFPTDNSFLHSFALRATGSCIGFTAEEQDLSRSEKLLAAREALASAFLSHAAADGWETKVAWQPIPEREGLRFYHGPRSPMPAHKTQTERIWCLEIFSPDVTSKGAEGLVESALRAMTPQMLKLRWVSAEESSFSDACCGDCRRLEVFVPRPEFTMCFPTVGTGAPRLPVPSEGDWLGICEVASIEGSEHLSFDVEVLAMVFVGLRDRRLLKEAGLPTAQYPCLFSHDIRLKVCGDGMLDGAAVLRAICEACGEDILLESFELDAEVSAVPSGERHWRLLLASVGSPLDDRFAYAVYQESRRRIAEMLGVELC